MSRRPSPNNNNHQSESEEHWNDWFTVNQRNYSEPLLDEQNRQRMTTQPITAKLAKSSKRVVSSWVES